MTGKNNMSRKLLSVFLTLCLMLTYLPISVLAAPAPSLYEKETDAYTLDDWKDNFKLNGNLDTENAGGVWTDKSVFTQDDIDALPNGNVFDELGIQAGSDSFLVSLSAIASNMTVAGQSSIPTDTMLVLDVSGSMNGQMNGQVQNNDVAEELSVAANTTIETLLAANPANRVGVVFYSGPSSFGSSDGDDATLALPMGRYTTSDTNGRFFNYTDGGMSEYISLNDSVVKEGTTSKPTAASKQVVGGTYIQNGLKLALDEFTSVTDTTVAGGAVRKPVIVLLSDGAPTLGTTDINDPAGSNMGDGGSSSAAIGFVTQLTASYVKQQVEAHYKTDSLFYTLSVGLKEGMSGYNIADYVLDPLATKTNTAATSIRNLWSRYLRANTTRVEVTDYRTVTYMDKTLEQYYVDQNFDTADYGTDLKQALVEAFKDIVANIEQQSKYLPTFVESSEHASGYVSFVDRIGQYMDVTAVKGIAVNDNLLYSGEEFANALINGGFGSVQAPTAMGDNFVWAMMERLGIQTADEFRALIDVAYTHGQLSYDADAGTYSNYLGWYGDANGQFLGHWYEGIDASTVPANAKYAVKSYVYVGIVDKAHHVVSSDMMYAVVQVRQDIATGEQMVTFALPASLVPVITYQVTLNENEICTGLTTSGALAPMRLIYEVALDSRINEYTVSDIVDDAYLAANTVGGKVNFYTNQYELTTGAGKVNTYAYFQPSLVNDRYYFQNDSRLYLADGTPYTGTASPADAYASGTKLYRKHLVYRQTGTGTFGNAINYVELSQAILTDAEKINGEWVIKGGHVRMNTGRYVLEKAVNATGTLPYVNEPYVQIDGGHSQNELGHNFIVAYTMGNNGRLSVPAKTGIKLSKTMAAGVTSTDAFTFEITTAASDNGTYDAYKVDKNGIGADTTVTFNNGVATATLAADETLYIEGLTAGRSYTVKEVASVNYKVSGVTVNGTAIAGPSANLTVVADEFQAVNFENTLRGTGSLTLSKEVTHPFEMSYPVPDKSFEIEVALTLEGEPLANWTNGTVTTDAVGNIIGNVTLMHGQQRTIEGLPEGTVATVNEHNPGTGFDPVYWENGIEETVEDEGVVTVVADHTVSVIVVNDYTPHSVTVDDIIISLTASKTISGRNWQTGDSFDFELQRRNATNTGWDVLETQSVSVDDTVKKADFTAKIKTENFDKSGIYYYRIVEVEPATPLAGVSYDKAIHAFYVVVTDTDMDGYLEISDVVSQNTATTDVTGDTTNGFNVDARFTNLYQADATNAAIEIHKTVENPSGSPLGTLDGFQFMIYEANAQGAVGDALPAANQPPLTSITGTTRATIHYTATGTYYYAVKEVNTGKPSWTYSGKTVYVTVKVTDDGQGNLIAVASEGLTGIGGTGNTVVIGNTDKFINTYNPAAASVDLDFVTKKLTGRGYEAGEFAFEITGVGYELTDASGNKLQNQVITGTNGQPDVDGISQVTFTPGKLYFTKVGTYFHNIVEKDTGKGGIAYDTNVGRLTVTVTDDNGTLKAVAQLVNMANNQLQFVNTYTVTSTSQTFTAQKELIGRTLMNDEFTFQLAEATDANGTLKTGGAVLAAENALDGSITFPAITYTAAGTYYYVVSEVTPTGDDFGIEYDTRRYAITLKVTDNGAGALIAETPTYKIVDGAAADSILFENTYKAESTQVSIPGNKILTGRVWNNDTFTFALYESDATWTQATNKKTVQNGTDGTFSFNDIAFDAAGTYYYLIKEENAGNTIKGVTYDDSVFRIEVVVTDDLRGHLNAEVDIFDENDIPQADVEFVNTYDVTGVDKVTLSGKKTLTGRDLADGEFSFALYETDSTFATDGITPATVQNVDGKFAFELSYGKDDIGKTYHYVVKEVKGSAKGITYDDTVYTVTVTVEDDLEGGVRTRVLVNGGNTVSREALNFNNVFTPEPPPQPEPEPEPQPEPEPEPQPEPVPEKESPKTGDFSAIRVAFALLCASTMGMIGMLFYGKKLKKEEQSEE